MAGKIYFYIFNGRKYCVSKGSNVAIEKVEDATVDAHWHDSHGSHYADDSDESDDSEVPPSVPPLNIHAMWQIVREPGGKYTFQNHGDGSYIVLGHRGIVTSPSNGENSKWDIKPAMDLSIDKCRIFKSNSRGSGGLFANFGGLLVLDAQKDAGDITQQADQLFKIVYAGGED